MNLQKANDDSESSDGSQTSDQYVPANGDNEYTNAKAEVRTATKGDDRGVFFFRMIVKVTMIVVAITLTTLTYVQLTQSEESEFLSAFDSYSESVIAYAENELVSHSEALEAMGDLFATYALATATNDGETTWPYVTLPLDQFEEHASHVTSFSYDGVVFVTPIVGDVTEWNTYCSDVMAGTDVPMSPHVFTYDSDGVQLASGATRLFTPLHQVHPIPIFLPGINGSIVNYDISSDPYVNDTSTLVHDLDLLVLSRLLSLPLIRKTYPDVFDKSEPISMLMEPIHSSFEENSEIVGYIQSIFKWKSFFSKLDWKDRAILCTIDNTCGDSFSIKVDGDVALVDAEQVKKLSVYGVNASAILGVDEDDITVEEALEAGICIFTLTIFPATEFRQAYDLNAAFYTSAIGLTMLLMVASFFAYDFFVRRRNNKVMKKAVQSTAIVTSLFPSNVRDRLYKEQEENHTRQQHENLKSFLLGDKVGLSSSNEARNLSKPLADLFTESTILFADIAGFTAWSSMREPCHVFTLLETLYAAFDAIAKRRRIFKIETIGDCYVAVAGVPEPMPDHAVAMSKFANDILTTMRTLTRQLEITLGPDTGDLALRIGLHSGPVTAGVLRGERARFQLFGDTMNTAARMEQTGTKNRIQVSQSTANYLQAFGKSHWLTLRDDKVVAKGKGELVTYWLILKSNSYGDSKSNRASETGSDRHDVLVDENIEKILSEKTNRLIDWNTDVLYRFLKEIILNRVGFVSRLTQKVDHDDVNSEELSTSKPFYEVKEIVFLPQTRPREHRKDESKVAISSEVFDQLRKYVSCIASLYNDNDFHNFEHATHVTMSVTKLISRIVAPSNTLANSHDQDVALKMHDHTYGITSDPLTQFACVFSALIHDVDHTGVPNSQLINENADLALHFDFKSVAEQNSIVVAWELLMKEEFLELRNAICGTKSELVRFRQLVVNSVMATDIMDKDLKNIRNMRWMKAFTDESADGMKTVVSQQEKLDQLNRKATVVIEHMIQASDVSHTMQHWHVYRKWNERFYLECYKAYTNGRSAVDPTDSWYQGELNFYDFYIIPLASKLNDCGAFGVSGTEYLQYAMSNRLEWQRRGEEIVKEMRNRVMEMCLTSELVEV